MNCIGVDLGGTRIKIGLVNEAGVQVSNIYRAEPNQDFSECLAQLKTEVQKLTVRADLSRIAGIGLAFPGLVDTDSNRVIGISGKYNGADKADLVQWARQELGMNLKVENDARLACLGEWHFGAGRGTSDLIFYTLGTGVGSSAIINNRLLRGKHFQAGILGGHFIIDHAACESQCGCGGCGCVESLASTWAIEHSAKNNSRYTESVLSNLSTVDLAVVFEHARNGDQLALLLRDQCLHAWGAGIVNMIYAYDPEVVVIGGGVARAKDILLPYFSKFIKTKAWTPSGAPEIRIAEHPEMAGVLGAYCLFN